MCNDNNIEKIKAKESVKLLICVLIGIVIVGGVWEYKKAQAPLDNVLVVYHRGENVAKKIDEKKVEIKKVEVMENKGEEKQEKVQVEDENKKIEVIENKEADEVKNIDAVGDFLGVMKDVRENLAGLEKPVSVLDKIKQEEVKVEDKVAVNPFNDGEIEIYDSTKGVIDVEKVEVIEEKKDESLKKENIEVQVIENKDEKQEEVIKESNEGTINMMEAIVSGDAGLKQ
ncbi:MAG: hypothetical protein IJZ30_00830 [Alphaproteobacteria bacterium]|nr:hypothetical protein [Alphaproteobacteria bacterium]